MATHAPILILDKEQIEQKINRLAYQIYEQNFDEQHMVVCGIAERGYQLAELIYHKLKQISPIALELASVNMNKAKPNKGEVALSPAIAGLEDKAVILCDDVLYTGKTLAYAALPFLQSGVKKLQCLVLIQRNYLQYPVSPVYVGMSLASTLQEHVAVDLEHEQRVYLK